MNQFFNFFLQLYGFYLKVGYVCNEKDYFYVWEFFQFNLFKVDYQELDFFGKFYFCQLYVWYYYMMQEFVFCYCYVQKWVDLFIEYLEYCLIYVLFYFKGLYNLFNFLFNIFQYNCFGEVLKEFWAFKDKYGFSQSKNIEGLYYFYYYIYFIKQYFLIGIFSKGLELVFDLMKVIEEDCYNWDECWEMVFYYCIVCLYFGSGDNDKVIDYFNLIINQKNLDYWADIQCFVCIFNFIVYYELGNVQLVEYQVKLVYCFLLKMEELYVV